MGCVVRGFRPGGAVGTKPSQGGRTLATMTRPAVREDFRPLASTQLGLATRRQLADLGWGHEEVHRLVERGVLDVINTQVLRVAGAPHDELADLLAAVMGSGDTALASHQSAMALWGFPGFRMRPFHVVHPHSRGRSGVGAVVHRSRRLAPFHATAHLGVPVVTPSLALLHVAARSHPDRVERLLENAWNRRLVCHASMSRVLEAAAPNAPGRRVLLGLLDQRGPTYRAHESGLEMRVSQLLRDDGQAPLARQIAVGEEFFIGRIDLVDLHARVLVQVDSDTYHGSLADKRRDSEQTARLESAGWTVIRATEWQIFFDPAGLVQRIRSARAAGRRQAA